MSRDPLPWKRVRKGERADHQVLRIGEDVFADPRDGVERSRVIIEADDWANVVPITTDGDVVLVKQFRFGTRKVSLELPGGAVDRGEDPAATVARELEEETGYRAGRVVRLGAYDSNPAHFTNRVHAFVALDCVAVHDGTPDHSEDVVVEVVPKDRVRSLARDGAITHALMLATIDLAILNGYL
jgi:8-oxo-dGTP pyrophosphatase MutT (NUDIX family)